MANFAFWAAILPHNQSMLYATGFVKRLGEARPPRAPGAHGFAGKSFYALFAQKGFTFLRSFFNIVVI
jgi:hypothetical protein